MTGAITAIETEYAGCRFRSRLEARWAVFFDVLQVPWKYEPEGYVIGKGQRYLPDFWLPEQHTWVEVKGSLDREGLAKLAVAAGPEGLPLRLDDTTRPSDVTFAHGQSWLDIAVPVWRRILILGDVPEPTEPWCHVLLGLSNGLHVVQRSVYFWRHVDWLLIHPYTDWHRLFADPPRQMPHGASAARLARASAVSDAYRAARSARFEHGESPRPVDPEAW